MEIGPLTSVRRTRSGELADPRVVERMRAVATGIGRLMVIVALVVLAGWWFDVDALKRLAGPTTMKAITALGFVFAGAALIVCRRAGAAGPWCGLPSLVVALLGLATLVEYAAGMDLAIAHVFPDPDALALGRAPGRMSQLTAVAFVLLGSLGMLVRSQRRVLLAQAMSLLLLALGALALALAGYRYVEGMLFEPVAWPTALLLMAGAIGWLALQPPSGVMAIATADSPGGMLLRRLALPAMLVPLALALGAHALERLGWNQAQVVAALTFTTGGSMLAMVVWTSYLLHRLHAQRRTASQLQKDATTDALTGLPNRRAFDASLDRLLASHRSEDSGFALLWLDLDYFKSYNDTFGHLAGDEVLRHTGAVLRSVLRPADIAARYGGEEFAILLPRTGPIGARRVASRLIEAFHAHPWPERPVTASIGIAWAQRGDTPSSLVARADTALYQAKQTGRDRACEMLPPAMSQMG